MKYVSLIASFILHFRCDKLMHKFILRQPDRFRFQSSHAQESRMCGRIESIVYRNYCRELPDWPRYGERPLVLVMLGFLCRPRQKILAARYEMNKALSWIPRYMKHWICKTFCLLFSSQTRMYYKQASYLGLTRPDIVCCLCRWRYVTILCSKKT